MPAPTIDLTITGTAPNEFATVEDLEQEVNDALALLQVDVDAATLIGTTAATDAAAAQVNVAQAQADIAAAEARITTVEGASFAADPIYPDTATGLGATTEGDQFKVENADVDIAYDVYSHDAGGVATLVSSVPSGSALAGKADVTYVDDLLDLETEIVGPATVTSGTTVGANNYAQDAPVVEAGEVQEIRIGAAAAGTVRVMVLDRSGSTFTVASELNVTVPASGAQTLVAGVDFTAFDVAAGQYLGFHHDGSVVSRVIGSATPFFNFGGTATDTTLTDAASQNNIILQFGATVVSTGLTRAAVETAALTDRLDIIGPTAEGLVPVRWLGIQGAENLSQSNTNASPIARQVIPAHAVPFDGLLTSIAIQALSTGVVTVRTMEMTGVTTFSQVQSQDITISAVGLQTLVAGVDFAAMGVSPGQYIAIDVPAGLLGQYAIVGYPNYRRDVSGETTFDSIEVRTTVEFQVGFEVTANGTPSAENHGFFKGRSGFSLRVPANGIITGDIGYGQSWLGENGVALEAGIVTQAHFPMHALKPLAGIKSVDVPFTRADLSPLRGDHASPSIIASMCNRVVSDGLRAGVERVNLAWQFGIGGQSLEELTSPEFPYHDTDGWYVNLLTMVTQSVQAAADVGCRYEVATLVWCQGAAGPADYTLYKTRFEEFVDKVQADIVTATGQNMKPTILAIQPQGYTADNLQALVDVCAERGDVVLGAAGWGYPRIDFIHFDAEGCIQLGEVLGIARSHIDQGRPWSAPYLRDVVRNGTTITANVGGPFSIVVDETIDAIMHYVPDGGGGTVPVANHGFEYSGANITNVVVEPNKVTITLDADAVGTLNFARSSVVHGDTNGNGNRGTIRADAIWPPLFASDDLRLWMAAGYWDL